MTASHTAAGGRRRADQLLAGFAEGDAISHEAIRLRNSLRSLDYDSDIFVDPRHITPSIRSSCHSLSDYRGRTDDLCFYHYGISSPATDVFRGAPGRRILVYHNITPAHFFQGYDDHIVRLLTDGRSELGGLARVCDVAWADSAYNARELREAGFRNVEVFPLLFSPETLAFEPDPVVPGYFAARLFTILYVGRLAPNKRVEHLIQAFAWFHRSLNPFSRLVIVGSPRTAPRYFSMLRMLAGDLDLPNVCFEGFASPAGLVAYYRAADIYVSASEHEGYCLPLLEAMHMGLPVIARSIGGVPEALAGAGVQYDDLDPIELAGLIHKVATNPGLRSEILQSQKNRIQEVMARDVQAELKGLLARLTLRP